MRLAVNLVLLLVFAVPASYAQPRVSGALWQLSAAAGQKRPLYRDVASLQLSPSGVLAGRPRVRLAIANNSSRPVEGLVLRYDFSISISSGNGKGFWAVPFHVSETRVSRLAPGSAQEVSIYQANLNSHLGRLRGTGFRPLSLRIRVMLEPRAGDAADVLPREFEIPFEGPGTVPAVRTPPGAVEER
ncbi:MAG TPA: hypothetical protein PKK31_01930 [Elusimicrobiales bacterium]|nr:hypothetical protein [Elusimicrobiales bacterium]